MSRVALETEKLIDYKGSGTLTREDVDGLVYKDADYRIYEMTNAVARKRFRQIFEHTVRALPKDGRRNQSAFRG